MEHHDLHDPKAAEEDVKTGRALCPLNDREPLRVGGNVSHQGLDVDAAIIIALPACRDEVQKAVIQMLRRYGLARLAGEPVL